MLPLLIIIPTVFKQDFNDQRLPPFEILGFNYRQHRLAGDTRAFVFTPFLLEATP